MICSSVEEARQHFEDTVLRAVPAGARAALISAFYCGLQSGINLTVMEAKKTLDEKPFYSLKPGLTVFIDEVGKYSDNL